MCPPGHIFLVDRFYYDIGQPIFGPYMLLSSFKGVKRRWVVLELVNLLLTCFKTVHLPLTRFETG